jgi:hypothetical protein
MDECELLVHERLLLEMMMPIGFSEHRFIYNIALVLPHFIIQGMSSHVFTLSGGSFVRGE